MNKIFSRKLWMTVAGTVGAVLTDFSMDGTVSKEVLVAAVLAVIAYVFAQGRIDEKAEDGTKETK